MIFQGPVARTGSGRCRGKSIGFIVYPIIRGGLLCALLCATALPDPVIAEDPIDFQRQILPLLSDRCFTCHGPHEDSRQAGLRLDQRDALLDQVTPGEPDASELWLRVSSDDENEQMPPPDSKLSLSNDERELIRKWIGQGAAWNRHWSLEPLPRLIPVPDCGDSQWPAGDLDRFVLARIEAVGKHPAPAAERWRWLRRVSLDLTGLPPTPEEIEAFENDDSADAFESIVDRLLASPRFGEHMAVSWLDAARYADSYGYQSDLLSPTWPWRDWLVRAINENLPYDRFLTWQLAGDLLPDATTDQRLATAFNRLHRMTNEGGSLELEWRTEYVADRVNTLGAAVLGMTMECARCHDHKYDPISQQDYYNLFAFFNSIDEWGMYHDSGRVPTPSLLLPKPAQDTAIAQATAALESARSAVRDFRQTRLGALPTDESIDPVPADFRIEPPVAHFPLDKIDEPRWLANTVDPDQPGNTSQANLVVPGRRDNALQLTGDDVVAFPTIKTGLHPWERFSLSLWIRIPEELSDAVLIHRQGGTDVGFFGTELCLHQGKIQLRMTRFWPGNALAIETVDPIPRGQWVHVVASNQATGTADGLQIYIDGTSGTHVVRNQLTKRPDPPGGGFDVGARFRSTGFSGGVIDELKFFDRPLSSLEVKWLALGTDSTPRGRWYSAADLTEHQLVTDPSFVALANQRAARVKQLLDARTGVQEVSVMQETAEPRPAWVLARGDYDSPRTDQNLAARKVPAALPSPGREVRRDRLGLARWLATPDHPRTARVAVNRIWHNFFATGLVATPSDFGVQGQQPSHPKLLDWLARDFVASGWDVKRLCKQIALSSTYRQDSAAPRENWMNDPQNVLLTRGPAKRLTAEMIRDLVLNASGLLNEEMGGPPVSPYQPQNLWREDNTMTPAYQQSVGQQLYRRSLYTVWKRTAPIPNMLLFDAAGREVCVASRTTTNTPLQALVLLNDVQFVEAARVLAERALQSHGDTPADAVSEMSLRLTGRSTDPREQELLLELYRQQLEYYQEHRNEADKLQAAGEQEPDQSLPPEQVAAMTMVAQAILGSDAAIWRR